MPAAACRNASRALGAYAAFLVYWALTLAGNSDAALVLGRAVRMPLLGIAVPLDFFFFMFPAGGMLFFLATRFYARRLFDSVAAGKQDDMAAAGTRRSTWLAASVLVSRRISGSSAVRSILAVFYWGSLPGILVYHFLRYLRVHEFAAAYVLGGLVMASTVAVAACWRMRPVPEAARPLLRPWLPAAAILAVLACQAAMVIGMIPWAAKGYYPGSFSPRLLRNFLQPLLGVDLSGLDLAAPDLVPGLTARPKGLGLRGIHLEGARLHLTKAREVDFQFAQVKVAAVDSCDLQSANFRMADLGQTTFRYSVLTGADLTLTLLRGARFVGCDLRGASFRFAWLGYGKLDYCQAAGADFRMANFEGTGHAFFTNFVGADLEGVNFRSCQVIKTNFARARLQDADFRDAELWKTDFSEADLEGANFLGAKFLEAEQLARAGTLYRAKLDPPLFETIKKNNPGLFEKAVKPIPGGTGPNR
jgi:uncharacterized protein YjbI with pentapeptide repeats